MKKKYDIIILTDYYPGFFGLEEDFLIKNNVPYLILAEKLKSKESNRNNTIQLGDAKNSLAILFRAALFFLVRSNYKNYITHKEENKWLKFKTSFNWIRKAFAYIQLIEKHCEITPQTKIYSFWGDEKAICAALLAQKYKLPAAVRFHGWDLYHERHKIYKLPLRHVINKYVESLVFISEQGRNYYLNEFPNVAHKAHVAYLGTPAPLPISTQTHPTKSVQLTLVSCSYLVPVKRIDTLFTAISELTAAHFQIEWHHLGGGKQFAYFNERIEKEQLENVHFHGDKSNDAIHQFFAATAVDVFVNVSESEGLPVSIMEAMSYGIPCIAPEIGGIPEAIQHAKNGFLLPKEPTVEEIKHEILHFYQLTSVEKTQMAQRAKATWTEKFDATNNTTLFYKRIFKF
jgi:glycosyltransferase involved in cell wall biosynthesis